MCDVDGPAETAVAGTGPGWIHAAPELPEPWGGIGQLLPPGATGALIRDLAFFDGHGSLHAVLTLTGWLVGGAALFALGIARHRDQPDPETAEHEIEEAFSAS